MNHAFLCCRIYRTGLGITSNKDRTLRNQIKLIMQARAVRPIKMDQSSWAITSPIHALICSYFYLFIKSYHVRS